MTQDLSKRGLGASEIAAVAGLNPHASPWDVWLSKTGQSTFRGNELTEWGHRLEPAIRQKYCDDTGFVVEVPARSMFHPSRSWQRATPDGIVYAPDRSISRLFQAKNVGEWPARRLWDAGVPDYVQLQEQWEMDVTGAKVADVCALVGGNEFRMFSVEYNAKLAADLVDIGAEFMARVERGIPPAVDHSGACKSHLASQMRKAMPIEFHADEETEQVIAEWKRLHVEAKQLEKRLDRARNLVRNVFASAQCERVVWRGGVINIQAPRVASSTDYEVIARLVASANGISPDEFNELVEANTTTKAVAPVLAAPADWKDDK